MARQIGGQRLKGKLGDISLYIDKIHGPMARMKGGPSKGQFETRESMAVNRKNASEFKLASQFGATIRNGLGKVVSDCKEYWTSRRMMGLLRAVVNADKNNPHGEREVTPEALRQIFRRFELIEGTSTSSFLHNIRIEENEKTFTVQCLYKGRPEGVVSGTHWVVKSGITQVDISKQAFVSDIKESEFTPILIDEKELFFEHPRPNGAFAFYGISICHFEIINGKAVAVKADGMKAGMVEFVG